jgi:hypothetical protein
VFNEISRIEGSTTPTVTAEVECALPEDSRALEEAFALQG